MGPSVSSINFDDRAILLSRDRRRLRLLELLRMSLGMAQPGARILK